MERIAHDPMIGRVLDGRYLVGPRVARGGMATVYEAIDRRLDRVVAVKVMHAGFDDDDFARRFVREARSAARLTHPNVVAVFDQGDDDGTLFLVMELVTGHTLRDVIRKEAPMSPAKALTLLEPVLSALAAAHDAGLIHRDVKPENVLLADDGRIKVADFGLARAVSAETQHTATSAVLIGTVSYLSPELVADGRADARADVYAAGVLLYEMLTGRKPHEGESPIQVAYKHVHEDVPAPSAQLPGIPAYVDALVARATARDQSVRPADARVLLHQTHRVHHALDHGLVDDPELTTDLAPTVPVARGGWHDAGDPDSDPDSDSDGDPGGTGDPRTGSSAPAWAPVDASDHEHTTSLSPGAAPALMAPREAAQARADDRRPAPGPTRGGPPSTGRGRRPRRRRGPVALVAVLLLAVLAGVGGWYFGYARYLHTPGVVSLSEPAAAGKVRAAGLHFTVSGRSYSETVAQGSVIRTDPAPGERILHDGTVSAVVSRGPERYAVPKLRGTTEEQARRRLDHLHLDVGDVHRRYSAALSSGRVLRSDPAPGQELRPGTAVQLVVSKGRRPIPVPDLTGKPADHAQHRLEKLGFAVERSEEYSDSVTEGHVVSQSPHDGTLFRRDRVSLVVSRGPQLVQVPDVVGMGVDDATTALQQAGFEVDTHHSGVYVGLQYVVSSDPKGGSMAPRGSTVTLSLV